MPSICLSAGDPSGDAHAARLVDTLKRLDPSLRFAGLGGEPMKAAGVKLLSDLTQAASIGPFDASRHLGRFADARRHLLNHLATARPELVILVDFGDFNLPVIAPLAKRYGARVVYFISPQLWAWGRFRLHWVRRYVDHLIVLFPFEEAFYRKMGIAATWVGHPLVEHAKPSMPREQAQSRLGVNAWRKTVGLLPGSRRQEIARHLPIMLKAAQAVAWRMPGVQFLVPKAPHVPADAFACLDRAHGLDIITAEDQMYDCLHVMDAALVASGTATLDCAMLEVPMAVVYRTSLPTYLAAKTVVRVPRIAMVNLIAQREVVREFVQWGARPSAIADELIDLLNDEGKRDAMREALRGVKAALGEPGAIDRAARVVLSELQQKVHA